MLNKIVFVTGGVLSSLGKGVAAATIGSLLEGYGLKVALLKMDPYLNIDPGTMSPFQHGEVYVLDDGSETDLDLGHYERFTSCHVTKENNLTYGKCLMSVLTREREGRYLGNTVQLVPHVTDEIKSAIYSVSQKHDVTIVEIGGTVGDIEAAIFIEAIRQVKFDAKNHDVCFVHMTLLPYIKAAGELKTKPTQHSTRDLLEAGIQPDILLCRCEKLFSEEVAKKLSQFCNVRKENIFAAADASNIYEIPLAFHEQGVDAAIIQRLQIECGQTPEISHWEKVKKLIQARQKRSKTVNIAFVGKYVKHQDAYKSVLEALEHGALENGCKIEVIKIDPDALNEPGLREVFLASIDGVLIPGGFGERGWEGKITTAKIAREENIPYFGICLGMQVAVVEYARNVCGMHHANSTEMNHDTPFPVVDIMEDQKYLLASGKVGGSMRLGSYECTIADSGIASKAYLTEEKIIHERHRHRYEFNKKFRSQLEEKGLFCSGENEKLGLVEIVEIPNHEWFLGCQFHPEFKSKPFSPHPLFESFVKSAMAHRRK